MRPGVRTRLPGADHHVVASGKLLEQQRNILRLMLAIGIHEDQHVTLGGTGAGLDGRAIAQGIMVAQSRHIEFGADIRRIIGRPIVNHNDLGAAHQPGKARQQLAQACGFIPGRNDDGNIGPLRHG